MKKPPAKKRGPGHPPSPPLPAAARRKLRSRAKSCAALADELGLTVRRVARERAALGLSLPVGRPRGSGLAELIPLDELRGSETTAAIARRYGVTRQAVSLVRLAAGVDRTRATKIEFAESDLLGAASAAELAEKYQCDPATVNKWRARLRRERVAQ